MNILVLSSKDAPGYKLVERKLDRLVLSLDKPKLISPKASPIFDMLEEYSSKEGIRFARVNKRLTRASDYIQFYKRILEKCDGLLVFWDGKDLLISSLIDIAQLMGLKVKTCYHRGRPEGMRPCKQCKGKGIELGRRCGYCRGLGREEDWNAKPKRGKARKNRKSML
jgi:hypothetical protein